MNSELLFPVVQFADIVGKTHQSIHQYCREKNIILTTYNRRSYLSPDACRSYFNNMGYKYPSNKIISFQACKGGVGKTSLCYNMAVRAAQYGAKVLVIDLDMQAHITLALLQANPIINKVWSDLFNGDKTVHIHNLIKVLPSSISLIPSNLSNSSLDRIISQGNKIHYRRYVKDILQPIEKDYDFVFIDCAPALSQINTAVTYASDVIFVPVNPDLFSFDGLEKTINEINDINREFSTKSSIKIILNRFDNRETNSLEVVANLKYKYGEYLCPTIVTASSEMKNSIYQGKSIFTLKTKPQIAEELDKIIRDLLNFNEYFN